MTTAGMSCAIAAGDTIKNNCADSTNAQSSLRTVKNLFIFSPWSNCRTIDEKNKAQN
ncbi:MAG: hypothetical protein F6K35_32920 [Okeania sp. SIO2H7]|nr:hypothetical protein [Okeania sp. SIO2H7]